MSAPKPRSQKRRKPAVVSFRATAEELALIDAAAKARGMTTSAWLRSVTVPLATPPCERCKGTGWTSWSPTDGTTTTFAHASLLTRCPRGCPQAITRNRTAS